MKAFPDMIRPRMRASPRARRMAELMQDQKPNSRSIMTGIIGAIAFHLLLLLAPESLFEIGAAPLPPNPEEDSIDIVMVSEEEEPPEPQYTETNPEAPENEPDKTANFAARSQQAANEEIPEELSPDRTPAREGEEEVPFEKFLSGQLEPQLVVPPAPETPEASEQAATSTPALQNPLSGIEVDENLSEEGTGMSVAESTRQPTPVPEPIEGSESPSTDTRPPTFSVDANEQRPAPAPRPRLPRALPGPVKAQPAGVSQTGAIAVDAKFSEYGEYIERMLEAVSQHWHGLCASRAYVENAANVVIEFKITSDGQVSGLETVDTTAKALGVLLCRTAIESGAPYGPWTEDMVAVLGTEQTITIRFHYW
jgi:hypothetical protein